MRGPARRAGLAEARRAKAGEGGFEGPGLAKVRGPARRAGLAVAR